MGSRSISESGNCENASKGDMGVRECMSRCATMHPFKSIPKLISDRKEDAQPIHQKEKMRIPWFASARPREDITAASLRTQARTRTRTHTHTQRERDRHTQTHRQITPSQSSLQTLHWRTGGSSGQARYDPHGPSADRPMPGTPTPHQTWRWRPGCRSV